MRYVRRTTRRLARSLFHAMVRFGPKLEKQQVLLGRFVDIGAELFAMAASCARAEALLQEEGREKHPDLVPLVDYFCRETRLRIRTLFREIHGNTDRQGYKVAQRTLTATDPSLQDGILE